MTKVNLAQGLSLWAVHWISFLMALSFVAGFEKISDFLLQAGLTADS
jgi:hypothetical protein